MRHDKLNHNTDFELSSVKKIYTPKVLKKAREKKNKTKEQQNI